VYSNDEIELEEQLLHSNGQPKPMPNARAHNTRHARSWDDRCEAQRLWRGWRAWRGSKPVYCQRVCFCFLVSRRCRCPPGLTAIALPVHLSTFKPMVSSTIAPIKTCRDDALDTLILKGIELCLRHLDQLNNNKTAAATTPTSSSAERRMKAIINMSIGRPARHDVFAEGLQRLVGAREDVLLFASAGNNGSAALRFPAA